MADTNIIVITGALGDDAKLHKGTVLSFRMASNSSYVDRQGQEVKSVQWHSIVAFGPLASAFDGQLRKGSRVQVTGESGQRSYDDTKSPPDPQTGKPRKIWQHQVKATSIVVLPSEHRAAQRPQAATGYGVTGQDDYGNAGGGDDIPF